MKKTWILGCITALLALGLSGAWAAESFPSFSSQTLDGQAVTSAAFAEAKLTVVNFWTTWCPPCVREMPDLGNLARNMPTGAKLVGILLDSDDPGAPAKARTILTRARADFPQILPSAEMRSILERVQAIPTTVFVDSKGQLVGEPIVGSRSEESYRKEIEARLRSLR